MIIRNSRVPQLMSIVIDVYAITIWPFIFIRDEGDEKVITHEKIHLRQQVELGIIGFYILYAAFWIYYMYKLGDKRAAYYAIPFEREAYAGDFAGEHYLEKRHNYEWINFL